MDLPQQEWFFSAPWDVPARRRGDALGLRSAADRFAEEIAPGLNNGTADARWLTLLSWCLQCSHDAWTHAGGGTLSGRESQRRRYAWLRPLELLWVARTISLTEEQGRGRQLPGQRSIRRWLDANQDPERFAMSEARFRSYRQTGVYGTYRVALRSMETLTTGDGWTPSEGVNQLARFVDAQLGSRARPARNLLDRSFKWAIWYEREDQWWLNNWPEWSAEGKAALFPHRTDEHARLGDPEERRVLARSIFPRDSRRWQVVKLLESSNGQSHAELCDAIARGLADTEAGPLLRALPSFTRLADAGMAFVDHTWSMVGAADAPGGPRLADVASEPKLVELGRQLTETARAWRAQESTRSFQPADVVDALADAVAKATSTSARLQALLRHHELYGGGLKWFRWRKDRIEPLLPQNRVAVSHYRFRIWPLSRLATQCGVANLRDVLTLLSTEQDTDEEAEG